MPQVESLSVQILGDSSGLQQELNTVAERLEGLEQLFSGLTQGVSDFGNALTGLSAALGPLQALNGQLGLIQQQIQQLASQPVTLNVQPALNALSQLMTAAQAASAQLSAISAMGGLGPAATIPGGISIPWEEAMTLFPRGYADGGVVTGPAGLDQVPAKLTAEEYVLNRDAVAALGVNRLDGWNRGAPVETLFIPDQSRRPLPVVSAATAFQQQVLRVNSAPNHSTSRQTTNHFGGIEIHVQETADVGELMLDLRRQGIGLRHRRG